MSATLGMILLPLSPQRSPKFSGDSNRFESRRPELLTLTLLPVLLSQEDLDFVDHDELDLYKSGGFFVRKEFSFASAVVCRI